MKKNTLLLCIFIVLSMSLMAQGNIYPGEFYSTPRSKLRISASGGVGYMLGKDNTDASNVDYDKIKKYNSKLRFVKSINADIHYLLTNDIGLGIKYNFHNSSASGTDFTFYINDYPPSIIIADVSEKQYLNFIGPSLFTSQSIANSDKIKFNALIALGYTSYRNETRMINIMNQLITSGTLGSAFEIGLDYYFTENFGIGVSANAFFATLNKITIDYGVEKETIELEKEQRISQSSINLSLGIRYKL